MFFFCFFENPGIPRYFLQLQNSENMFTDAESLSLIQELLPHFQKATLLSAFLTWSQFPSSLAPLPNPGLCQQLGVEEGKKKKKKKKTSQVKFKDVFLLDAGLHCHKPRETFSCSTFFMVSLWVSSLPFSLHLGSRVTYCCTGCKPQPAGHSGVASSPTLPPPPSSLHLNILPLSLDGSHSGESLRVPHLDSAS